MVQNFIAFDNRENDDVFKANFDYYYVFFKSDRSSSSESGTTGPRGEWRVKRIGMFSRSGLSRCRNRTQDKRESRVEVPVAQQARMEPST
jgi:hypothetical protein